jgi:type IV pilus assembly protein PilE
MQRTRRDDAHDALLALASAQERYYLQMNTYAPDFITLKPAPATNDSPKGYYTLTVAGNASSYTLSATATGDQINDTACPVITLTSAGQKTPVDCW